MSLNPHFGLAARKAALDNSINLLNSGEIIGYTGAPLSGTVTITNNSASITFSTSQTLVTGDLLQFSDQANVWYTVSVGGTGTAFTLTAVYSGTGGSGKTTVRRPGTTDTAPYSGDVALFTLALPSTAFAAAAGSAGGTVTKTANAITAVAASNTGLLSWFRGYESDDATGVVDGSAGTSGCEMTLATASIVALATISVTSLVISFAA